MSQLSKDYNKYIFTGTIVFGIDLPILISLLQVMNFLKKMAGNEYVGFSNATYVEL